MIKNSIWHHLGWDARWDNHYFFPIFSCFRTSFPVLDYFSCFRTSFPVLERPILFQNVLFLFFGFFWESDFVPGCPRIEEFVPGFLLLPLSQDSGTVEQGNILSRDVQFLGNSNLKPLGFCAGLKVFRVESTSSLLHENCGGISNTSTTCLARTVQH